MTPLALGAGVLRLLGRKTEAPRWMAWLAGAFAILALLLAILAAWRAFDWFNDREAVKDAANEANAEFTDDKDRATGKADTASQTRAGQHQVEVKRTEELIDEALEKNCVVADYLASNGADCVQPPAAVSRPAA